MPRKLTKPNLSVIIPAYNEENSIESCLKSLLTQSYPAKEIIIVDDGSTDNTREIIQRLAKANKQLKLLKGKHEGPGVSRNLGAQQAKGEVLILVDADMTFDKGYLKELIKPIQSGKTIGTEDGQQIASNPKNVWSRCWGTYFKDYIDQEKGYIFRAILKSSFQKMGGFNSKYGYADDLTFYYDHGATSIRVPKAKCYHKNPETLNEVYKQSRWIGASLNNTLLTTPLINLLAPFLLLLISPILITLLTIKKTIQTKNYDLFFPWMFLFIITRYFGTLEGIARKVYLNKNTR